MPRLSNGCRYGGLLPSSPYDPAKNVLPTETVFEHGFYPLQGSFKLEQDPLKVFTQWVEILPTDQIVAIEYIPEDHL